MTLAKWLTKSKLWSVNNDISSYLNSVCRVYYWLCFLRLCRFVVYCDSSIFRSTKGKSNYGIYKRYHYDELDMYGCAGQHFIFPSYTVFLSIATGFNEDITKQLQLLTTWTFCQNFTAFINLCSLITYKLFNLVLNHAIWSLKSITTWSNF